MTILLLKIIEHEDAAQGLGHQYDIAGSLSSDLYWFMYKDPADRTLWDRKTKL